MVELSKPQYDLAASYISFLEDMRSVGEKVWDGFAPRQGESANQFVDRLIAQESTPSPGLVAESQYWATLQGEVVGRISLRHELTENLREFGGHIGYEVRPSHRRKGFATEMLRQLLLTSKAKEIGHILITCAPNNIASNKTIVANGGVLTKTAYVDKWKRDTNCYWIRL